MLSIASLCAQPTISPATVTLTPGATQQFTTNAKIPYWNIGGSGVIDLHTGKYTAPAILPSIGATVRVTDLSTGQHADAIVTLVAAIIPTSQPCSCPGDVFVVSDSPAVTANFSKSPDGSWRTAAQFSSGFLALVKLKHNGATVMESDIVGITYTGGILILETKVPWPSGDVVSGTWVAVSK